MGFLRQGSAHLKGGGGGGLESSNTCSVWSVELLSKQAIVRMQGPAIGGTKGNPQDRQRQFI